MSDSFWDFYWELRLQEIETLGKRAAILAASRLLRQMSADPARPMRVLELGCGEGQIIGPLFEAHGQGSGVPAWVGVDYKPESIATARRSYPGIQFHVGDFTDPQLLESLGQFQAVLLVNALHEVFSAAWSEQIGEVDVPDARRQVDRAFAGAVERLAPGGYLLLFDGLEPAGDLQSPVRIRFLDEQARLHFETFARQYHPFRIQYQTGGDPNRVELSLRDFTRYITKSIFLGKALWQSERFESYQYFNEAEFRAAFERHGLAIRELHLLTVDEEKWRRTVEIESPGVDFPNEHILIIGQKAL